MSIGAKPWEGGGAASVPDASETTKGKIRIATSAEAASGLDDLTAMTPLTVKERIDAALAGGVEYKGTFNATTGLPSLANAEQGDLYRIATGGTIYGETWALNDNLLINADMGGVIDNAKIDKIDNTDAVTSVNTLTGPVVLNGGNVEADYTATSYIASSNNINGHLEGIDDEFLVTAPLASPALTGTPTAPTATQGDNSTQIATTAYVDTAVAAAGGISSVSEDTDPTLGGDLKVGGFAITSTSNGDVTIDPDGIGEISIGADIMPDADATHTIGDENTRFISAYTDINGAIRFKAKNDQGASISKGQAVYIKGVSGTVPTVGLARANSASTMPAFGLALADANDQAEVQVVTFGNLTDYNTTTYSLSANQTVYVSSATAGALTNTAPTGESNLIQNIGRVVRADASAGIIKVGGAGRSNATPNLDQDKIFVGNASNQAVSTALSAINLSSFNDDLTSTYQPLDAGLTSISGLTTSADKMIYTTASDTYAVTPISAAGRSFVSANDAGAQRSALGLGTAATSDSSDFQPIDAGLTSISGLTTAADKMIYTTALDTYATTSLTTFGRALLDDADATTARSTLSLGTASTEDVGTSANNVVQLDGSARLPAVDGSQLTNLPSGATALNDLTDVTITGASTGEVLRYSGAAWVDATLAYSDLSGTPTLGTAAALDVGTSANNVVQLDGSARLPAVDGSQLTNLPSGATSLNGLSDVTITGASTGEVLRYNGATWVDATLAYSDLSGTPTLGTAAALDVGTSANNVVQLDGSARLPAVDGSQLTNLPSGGGGVTYSAITADPANAQAGYHYSCTGTFTITLATSGYSAGDEIRVKNMGTGTITIDPQTGTIDGSTTDYTLDVQYSAITLVSTGTNWEII